MHKKQKGFAIVEGLLIVVIVAIVGLVGWYVWKAKTTSGATHQSAAAVEQAPKPSLFDHIVIIVEENRGYKTIMESADAPYIHDLAATYAQANNYSAVFRPSLPNYLAMTAGTNGNITSNCTPSESCTITGNTLVDEIEASNRTWKGYMESMPSACSLQNSGNYAVKHNPFAYFKQLTDNQKRCQAHNVPLDQLYTDLSSNQLPNYAFITPNLCSDMHDCSIKSGDAWLANLVPKILDAPSFKTKRAVLIVTWDEAEVGDSGNHIPTILAGPVIKKGYTSTQAYTHYSLLRTIEKAWQLQPLTENDKAAAPLDEFFSN